MREETYFVVVWLVQQEIILIGRQESLFCRSRVHDQTNIIGYIVVHKGYISFNEGFLPRKPHKMNYTPFEPRVTTP